MGGEPQTVAQCTACGRVYPAQADDGRLRPIGTEGTCECGNDEFVQMTGE
jgi:predicted  nucleic acid-binding Zn-ribbon protein